MVTDVPVTVLGVAVNTCPTLVAPEIVALAMVGVANTSVVALEVALADPPAFVTVITTLINFVASPEVKTYVDDVAPEMFE